MTVKCYHVTGKIQQEDGSIVEWSIDLINEIFINSEIAINDPELKEKYPELFADLVAYLVHNS